MTDRTAALMASMQKSAQKRGKSQAKRKAKRSKTRPEKELQVEWSARFREVVGDVDVPAWGPAERSLAKKLVGELGFEKAVAMVRHFLGTWKARRWRTEEARGDVPSMKRCWNVRQKLLAEMAGTVKTPTSKRDRMLSDEYDEESAAASPDEGWLF